MMTRLDFIKGSRLVRVIGKDINTAEGAEAVVEYKGKFFAIDLLKGTLSHLLSDKEGKATNFRYSKVAINDYLAEL